MLFFKPRTWLLGIKSLRLHPLRSLLTMLGIFIGTASVIWLLAIGEGISHKAQEQIANLGANNIIIRTLKPPQEDVSSSTSSILSYGIRRDDLKVLRETIPTVINAIPIREIQRQFRYRGRMVEGRLVACTPDYAEFTHLAVENGTFLSDVNLDNMDNVCVLAAGTARKLFPYEDPLGQPISVDSDTYVIIGVMRERTASAAIGGSLAAQDFSFDVYVPITTFQSRVGDMVVTMRAGSFSGEIVELSQLTLQVADVEKVLDTAAVVNTTMKARHEMRDYAVVVPRELLDQARNTRLMFIAFMGLIAAISLVVGGIGIMNIMLATVTERTREIGIRRALGARRMDIAAQFLVETVVLSVTGGLTGVLAGLTCAPVVRWARMGIEYFFAESFRSLPDVIRTVEPIIVNESVPFAFGISVGIGIVFGLYPALRASLMDPIEALRHE